MSMKKSLFALVIVTVIVGLLGCGVSKEDHEKVQKELANTQASLQAKAQEQDKCAADLKTCQMELDQIKGDLMSLSEDYSKLGEEKQKIGEEYVDVKSQLAKIRMANELRQKAMDELLAKFESLIKSGKLTIGVNDGRMVIQLPSNVLFPVGKSNLSKDGKQAVQEVAEVLKTINGRKFQVAGHADTQRPKGKVNPNWTLSYSRARAVFDLMIKDGMNESLLSLAAYAEFSPVADNNMPAGQEMNRRIEIVLLPTSDELPMKQLKQIQATEAKIEKKVEEAAAPAEEKQEKKTEEKATEEKETEQEEAEE